MNTITITRAERDVILSEVWRWTQGDPIPFDTREQATESIEKLQHAFALRNELDAWESTERDSFTVTMTPQLIKLVRVAVAEIEEMTEYDRGQFTAAKAGNLDYWPASARTVDGMVTILEEQLRHDEHMLAVTAAVLSRLDAEAVSG